MAAGTGLISVAEAHARIARLFAPLESEAIPLAEAAGRVLALPVIATRAQPPFAASAMDGYAVRAADVVTGATLRVLGTSAAGAGFAGPLEPGAAVRIFTGAPVPDGADMILIQEDAERSGDAVRVRDGRDTARYIRPAGSDFAAGACVTAPRRLRPSDIALIAAMNAASVQVARRPVIALIPTGDELVMPGETPGPDQIVSSNNFGLKAMLEALGAEVRLLPIARDTAASLSAVFALAEGADLIVTLGGASVGELDLVQSTAIAHGLALDFYKIAMRPGKPLMAGRMGGVPMLGLPGNPVSAMVTGRLFLCPAVEAMLGLGWTPPPTQPAELGRDLEANGPREHYLRAQIARTGTRLICTPFERQDSALLSVLAAAEALMVRAPHDPARTAGDQVEFIWM